MTRYMCPRGCGLACLAAGLAAIAASARTAAAEEAPPPADVPEAVPVTPEPMGPAAASAYRGTVRLVFWPSWLSTDFRKAPGTSVVSLEDTLDAEDFHVLFPIEAVVRSESQEFRFRYVWWNSSVPDLYTGSFGSAVFTSEAVRATLETDVVGIDFVQRIVKRHGFGLYLSAGADIFITEMDVHSALFGDSIKETVPILTVGLGLRVRLKDDLSIRMAKSALSYSQLLGMSETFFDVKDTYSNIDISLQWEPNDRFNWGAGWRHYEVGFENTRLRASQKLRGPCMWMTLRF